MPIYTVHAPTADTAGIAATDRFAFVRDGFHFWAALLGPLWLAWHRLWLALFGGVVLFMPIGVGIARAGARGTRLLFANAAVFPPGASAATRPRRRTSSRPLPPPPH